MSNLGDLIDQDAQLRTLAPAAVGSQVLFMSVVSVSHHQSLRILF